MHADACKKAVFTFYESVWNAKNRGACKRLMAEDVAFRGSLGPVRHGRDGFWAYVEEVTGALQGYHCEVEAIVGEEDVAFAKVHFSGVHRGEFMGYAPTGMRVGWTGAAHFQFRAGRIAILWVLGDLHSLVAQLDDQAGAAPAPASTVPAPAVETFTPPGTMTPIGPYRHVAVAGDQISIGGVAGIDPATGAPAGDDVASQTTQILSAFEAMLEAAGSDLDHIVHVNVFLKDMADFDAMNDAYAAYMGARRPARTAIGVSDLPKPGLRLTMNLTAVKASTAPTARQ